MLAVGRNRSVIFVLLISVVVMAVSLGGGAASAMAVQLTDNANNDVDPQISGNNVVWAGHDGNDYEIFLYNGSTGSRLTDNNVNDWSPQISGNKAVWTGSDGTGAEIFLYNGSSVSQLTANGYADDSPQISGNNVVWRGYDAGDWEIFLYKGSATSELSGNDVNDWSPQISGNKAVWYGSDGTDDEIFLYNGSTTTQTDYSGSDSNPQISGDNVVWQNNDGGDWEIYFFNGSTRIPLTNNSGDDIFPQISGNNVAWAGFDGSDAEIFFYNGSAVTQLTNNGSDDSFPQISGNNIVWNGFDGSDYEIFSYNGSAVSQLTDNSGDDWFPQISGDNVVWQGFDGQDNEIFLATLDTIPPTALVSAPRLSTQTSKTTKFRVSWSAVDPAPSTGIASYDVQYRQWGRDWNSWLVGTTAKSTFFKGREGKNYYFRARAKDSSGNLGPWSPEQRIIVPFDNDSLISQRRGFGLTQRRRRSPLFKGTVRYSTRAGDEIVYHFKGRRLYLISTKARDRSKAAIYIDDRYIKTIDTHTKTTRFRKVVFEKRFSKSRRHTLKIVNLGNRARLDIDGLAIAK